MMVVDNKFQLGQEVYLITDPEQLPRMVTGIKLTPGNMIYHVAQGTVESQHYECEISAEVCLDIKIRK